MNWFEPTEVNRLEWNAWLAERPEHVRLVAARFTPWVPYKLTTTGQRCSVIGFHEVSDEDRARIAKDGCDVSSAPVTVYIQAEHPYLGEISARNVFGIDPDTLVPWTEGDEVAVGKGAMPSIFR